MCARLPFILILQMYIVSRPQSQNFNRFDSKCEQAAVSQQLRGPPSIHLVLIKHKRH